MREKNFSILGIIACFLLVGCVNAMCSSEGREIIARRFQNTNVIENEVALSTLETTCRSMIDTYNNDVLFYKLYHDSIGEEMRIWAEHSKVRANETAVAYNTFVKRNLFRWEGKMPTDICIELEIIE